MDIPRVYKTDLIIDSTEKLRVFHLHLLPSEYRGRGWVELLGCQYTTNQGNNFMLEIVATSCWLVSAPRCVYLLPARLELDGQLCLSFHYFFSLTKQYTGFIQGQDLCLYNFLYVTGSCVRGLKTQLLLAIQDIPLNLCILFPLVQESGRKKGNIS